MDILIFKTNLADKTILRKASPIIRALQGIIRWTVDLHDDDKVLRIETLSLTPQYVEATLRNAGYYCEELKD